ncbi:MAG: hypothetical protein Q9224_003020 [Gallowayella concinna]
MVETVKQLGERTELTCCEAAALVPLILPVTEACMNHQGIKATDSTQIEEKPIESESLTQCGIQQDWARDTSDNEYRPGSANATLGPRSTAAMSGFRTPQARETAHPVEAKTHQYPNFLGEQFSRPVKAASEVSHFISALDTESLHNDHNGRAEDLSHATHSHPPIEDMQDDRFSTSDGRSARRGSERRSWSGRSSEMGSSGERGDRRDFPYDSAATNASYADGMKKADKVTTGDHWRPQEETDGGPVANRSHNEVWSFGMWNDEDNNPYGSFDRHGSPPEDQPSNPQQSGFERPLTPTSGNSSPTNEPPEFVSRPRDLSDDDEDNYAQQRSGQTPRKKGTYDSRIEQMLYENPDLQIVITDAGKSHESGGSYIVYTIRTGDLEVRRRYSEFHSLRSTLVNLHPTLIIPPIPEKHSMADYAAKPTKAKEDIAIIDLRKRMLTMFLNRCRKMRDVREDGVWWRFLDPNASWNEVLHSHPVTSIPKSIMKAPPLDPSNPTPAHQWLPVPSTSAKLRSVSRSNSTGTPTSPPHQSFMASTAAHTIPAPQLYSRFPPSSQNLTEQELDPYFSTFESNTRELELLLQGNIEKVNRRTLTHLSALSTDMAELGARYNGFSLSEQSATVAAAVERIGQAADSSYIATEELSSSLGANFAEPMRESAQFAGVVRSVLRYRIMKRVQEEMTKDELYAKRNLLESLERSEMESKRIEQYLSGSTTPGSPPKRSTSSASAQSGRSEANPGVPSGRRKEGSNEEVESVDSDFPSVQANGPSSSPSSSQGTPEQDSSSANKNHRKSQSGGFVANKIFGRISHAIHGVVDVDPERTRRDTIGKTKEGLVQLEQALEASEKDVKDASAGVLKDLKRFQLEKEDDLKRYMMAYARCHIHWAKRNVETWREAKEEVNKIDVR